MFQQLAPEGEGRRLPVSTAFSVGAHGLVITLLILVASIKAKEPVEKLVDVAFVGPGKKAGAPPPPPPPPAARHRKTPQRKVALEIPKRAEVVKPLVVPPKVEAPPEPDEPDDPEGAVEGGVEGGVAGGVVGGVVGGVLSGQVGGQGGGGAKPAVAAERPKARNVPSFVIQRDLIQQTPLRLSEVFKQANRGKEGLAGMYKVCVDTDGHVYEVTAVKSVPGADQDIIEGIKGGWLFKPQQVPVCFLFNTPITVR